MIRTAAANFKIHTNVEDLPMVAYSRGLQGTPLYAVSVGGLQLQQIAKKGGAGGDGHDGDEVRREQLSQSVILLRTPPEVL